MSKGLGFYLLFAGAAVALTSPTRATASGEGRARRANLKTERTLSADREGCNMQRATLATLATIIAMAAMPWSGFAQDIIAGNAWSRATPPVVNIGAIYLTIENRGGTADRIVGASTPAARRVELHLVTVTDDIARMRRVASIEIPPNEQVVFNPNGYHLMLFGLRKPLQVGETLDLTIDFEKVGPISLRAEIRGLREGEEDILASLGHQHGVPTPLGVMGDHMHEAGEWMVSYRFMHMDMAGNRIGTDDVSPEEIVTTVPNPFGGRPTLRVVPTDMTVDMHMFGLMNAPADWLTVMAMTSYQEKEMSHVTFGGAAGTVRLGEFTTRSRGLGDTRLTGLIRLLDVGVHHAHLNAGVSFPTGSIDAEDAVLSPANTRPVLTLPYPMQLGSGTYDLLPGLTYTVSVGDWGWGAQYTGVIRIGRNDADYALGDQHALTAWGSHQWNNWLSTTARVKGRTIGTIDGQDPRITVPVQTALTNAQGGDRLDVSLGASVVGQSGFLSGHEFGIEVGLPVYQDLNGPQLETDWVITVGWKFAFGPL
ncbi:MAG: copper chaperone PCu(A)C [Alphaproteobacteria bacterium]|jgi:copper(I)-binding protein|nr:copper chaperone PCu(A)C [Alphaproteobacteria bacterium]